MPAKKGRHRLRGRIARRWIALGALVLVGLLYYRPLHDYLGARSLQSARAATVTRLEREQARLELKLHRSSSIAVLAAEARALGYVRPGEHLFIVKDLPQWRHRQNASRRGRGG